MILLILLLASPLSDQEHEQNHDQETVREAYFNGSGDRIRGGLSSSIRPTHSIAFKVLFAWALGDVAF